MQALQARAAIEAAQAEANRFEAEAAASAEADRLAAEARRLAAEVVQADLVAGALTAALPPSSDTRVPAAPVASRPLSHVTPPAALPRPRRQITRTVGGTEAVKQLELNEAKAQKAAETRARNKAKRAAEGNADESRPIKRARATKSK